MSLREAGQRDPPRGHADQASRLAAGESSRTRRGGRAPAPAPRRSAVGLVLGRAPAPRERLSQPRDSPGPHAAAGGRGGSPARERQRPNRLSLRLTGRASHGGEVVGDRLHVSAFGAPAPCGALWPQLETSATSFRHSQDELRWATARLPPRGRVTSPGREETRGEVTNVSARGASLVCSPRGEWMGRGTPLRNPRRSSLLQ
jgi:hypothetical protein